MLNRRTNSAAALMLVSLGFSATLIAAPYQFAIGARAFQSKFDNGFGGSNKSTTTNFRLSYYLRPVVAPNGPLGERAYLSKASRITGNFGLRNPDVGDKTDSLGVQTRFVTASNLIVYFSYDKTNREFNDSSTIGAGVGKYLDDRTTANVSLSSYDSPNGFADRTTLSTSFRKLIDGAAPNTYIAYTFGLDYTDFERDNEFVLDAGGTYYLSNALSAGASISHGFSDFSSTTISLSSSYYFSEQLVGGAFAASTNRTGSSDSNLIGFTGVLLF